MPYLQASPIHFEPPTTRAFAADGPAHNERAATGQARTNHPGSSRGNQQHQHCPAPCRWITKRCDAGVIAGAQRSRVCRPSKRQESRNCCRQAIEVLLTDEQRPGAPATFTFEQFMQIMALACEKPEAVGSAGEQLDPARTGR